MSGGPNVRQNVRPDVRSGLRGPVFGVLDRPPVSPFKRVCALADFRHCDRVAMHGPTIQPLGISHRRLDAAVFAVYGWDPILSDDQLLQRLLDLNLGEATQIPRKTNTTDTANGEQS